MHSERKFSRSVGKTNQNSMWSDFATNLSFAKTEGMPVSMPVSVNLFFKQLNFKIIVI